MIVEKILAITVIFTGIMPIAFGEAYIQNDQQYVGDDNAFHIVGEIKNDLKSPLNQIKVHATLFDENNEIIVEKETSSLVNTIMPGMKGPFDMILTNIEAKKTKSYSLELEYKISPPKNQVIDITESEISRDKYNNLMIKGTVANKGDITANTVAITATLYDKEGKVAAVNRIHPEPDYLRVEDNAFFLVTIPDKIQTKEISNYALIAESEEYAAVPEFPIALALLAATMSAYIGITRYPSKLTANLIPVINSR